LLCIPKTDFNKNIERKCLLIMQVMTKYPYGNRHMTSRVSTISIQILIKNKVRAMVSPYIKFKFEVIAIVYAI